MSSHRVSPFAIESEQALQATIDGAMTVRGIGDGWGRLRVKGMQHRPLLIDSKQCGMHRCPIALLLCEKLIVLLEHRVIRLAPNFCGQPTFAVKTLRFGIRQ
ncbi:hypothetical protein EMIT0P253_20112 [Pseudomonas sp. IT-P253]|jgi:hypothetical protein